MAEKNSSTQVAQTRATEDRAPCLIGARTYVIDTLPALSVPSAVPYFNQISVGDGMTASLDMVRLSLHMADEDWLLGHADAFSNDAETWTGRGGIGSYHVLWRFPFGDSAVVLGVGQRKASGRVDMHKGFLELNPNKTAHDERFAGMVARMSGHVSHAHVKRYDLAVDLEVPRNTLRMGKDRRKYQALVDQTISEYLGIRNRAGFCKLYDKAVESGVGGELTRVELTCDGDWSADEVMAHWPQVYSWSTTANRRTWAMVLSMALADIANRGGEIESYLARLPRSSRKTVRESLQTSMVTLPREAAEYAVTQALSWANAFA